MSTKRHAKRCTRFIRRNIFGKIYCSKRAQGLLIATSFSAFMFYFMLLVTPESQYTNGFYSPPNTQTKLTLRHSRQEREILEAFIQYSGNISYRNTAFLKEKLLETRQNVPAMASLYTNDVQDSVKNDLKEKKRDFIHSINVSEIPLNRTAFGSNYTLNATRSDIYDFPFIVDGKDICRNTTQPFLVIMVLSVHTHIDTRLAIRNTWGRAANPGVWPKVGQLKNNVKLIFLFGKAGNDLGNNIVKEESKMHGDVVQADFVDSYFNLTYKTVTGIRWVAEFCPDAKYILKADEDVFVHVHNLINFLAKREKKKHGVVFGHALMKSDVFRTGRWAVATRAYPHSVYPTYTCGNTYVISGNMAPHIYYTAGLLPYLNIEDVFVTGIVRTFLNAVLVDVPGFTHWFERKPKPCEFKNTVRISATKVTDFMQNEIWEGLKTKEADCYKPVQVKNVKINRPERHIRSQIVRDEHIFMNKTNGKFYVV